MHADLSQWASDRSTDIQNKIIEGVTNGSIDHKIFDEDARIQAWINSHVDFIRTRLQHNISQTAPRDYGPLAAWTTEAADVAYSKAATDATQMAKTAANTHYE
jgi:hypothetical protein